MLSRVLCSVLPPRFIFFALCLSAIPCFFLDFECSAILFCVTPTIFSNQLSPILRSPFPGPVFSVSLPPVYCLRPVLPPGRGLRHTAFSNHFAGPIRYEGNHSFSLPSPSSLVVPCPWLWLPSIFALAPWCVGISLGDVRFSLYRLTGRVALSLPPSICFSLLLPPGLFPFKITPCFFTDFFFRRMCVSARDALIFGSAFTGIFLSFLPPFRFGVLFFSLATASLFLACVPRLLSSAL